MTQLVSIIIPCYNDEPSYVVESVISATNQSYPAVEVVVVDDGSTRRETIETLNGLKGIVLVRQNNAGPGAALNLGIQVASGSLILPLGADDRIDTHFVDHAVKRLLSSPDIVGVFPTVEHFGLRNGVIDSPEVVTFEDIVVRNRVVAVTLFRKSDWNLVGGYGGFDDCSEDWFFFAKLLGVTGGRFEHEPRAHFYYRIRLGSRNSVNRGRDRKENLRRHVADALPDLLPVMYLAAADQADTAISKADKYGAYIDGWRRRLKPVMPIYRTAKVVQSNIKGRRISS